MGIEDQPQQTESWLFKVAAKKITAALVKGILAFLASAKMAALLTNFGVSIDPKVATESLTVALYGLLEAVHDWAKVKFGWKWL